MHKIVTEICVKLTSSACSVQFYFFAVPAPSCWGIMSSHTLHTLMLGLFASPIILISLDTPLIKEMCWIGEKIIHSIIFSHCIDRELFTADISTSLFLLQIVAIQYGRHKQLFYKCRIE